MALPTGSPVAGRYLHTATKLNNGHVLIVGGSDSPATAELYDSATETFTVTGSPHISRMLHTATLLSSGKVLIVGGSDLVTGATASAELYDSATGTFEIVGSLATPRMRHKAVVLPDGRVLITSGVSTDDVSDPSVILASAEIFDPATNIFLPAANVDSGRTDGTVTALQNGEVLVASGYHWALSNGSCCIVSGAIPSLYYPALGTFAPTDAMNAIHIGATASL
jgi:hypothetical protein